MGAGTLFSSMFVSLVGFGFFSYGKKQARPPQLATGLVLMVFPYFVDDVWLQVGIAVALLALMGLAIKARL